MSGRADLASRRRERLRDLPSVDEVLRDFDGAGATPRGRVVEAVRAVLDESRRAVLAADSADELERVPLESAALRARIEARLVAAAAWHLDRVINATGVVLHTNLGRAPLGAVALDRRRPDRRSLLEPRAATSGPGERGSRYDHVDALLCRLTGAEAALVVNNNAAAVLLALAVARRAAARSSSRAAS